MLKKNQPGGFIPIGVPKKSFKTKPTSRRIERLKNCFFRNSVPRITATDCGKYAEMLFFYEHPLYHIAVQCSATNIKRRIDINALLLNIAKWIIENLVGKLWLSWIIGEHLYKVNPSGTCLYLLEPRPMSSGKCCRYWTLSSSFRRVTEDSNLYKCFLTA